MGTLFLFYLRNYHLHRMTIGTPARSILSLRAETCPIRLVALAVALQHCPARGVSFGGLLDLQLAAIEWTLGATADSPEARVNEGPSGPKPEPLKADGR